MGWRNKRDPGHRMGHQELLRGGEARRQLGQSEHLRKRGWSQVQWYTPMIPTFKRLRQEDWEFKTYLSYIARLFQGGKRLTSGNLLVHTDAN